MATAERWRVAQEYEQGFWASMAADIAAGKERHDWYKWRAEQVAERLRELGFSRLTDGSARVLEIGSGPTGVVRFFPAAERVAVDPLNDFYAADTNLSALRTNDVQYVTGVGEELARADASVDLVIMENCIDHTRDVDLVLSEIERVLRPGGVLYLTVNCRSLAGFAVHRLISSLNIDAGHPHTFTYGKLVRTLSRPKLASRSIQRDSLMSAWLNDLKSPKGRDKVKALLGVSEYLATAYSERK